jgi:hypothetical protein
VKLVVPGQERKSFVNNGFLQDLPHRNADGINHMSVQAESRARGDR